MVYANANRFTFGCVSLCLVVMATAIQIDTLAIWSIFGILCVITLVRAVPIYWGYGLKPFQAGSSRQVISPTSYYAIGGVVHMFAIGLWVLIVFVGPQNKVAELFAFTAAMCFMIGVVGRNFASRKLVISQILAAAVPMAAGLVLLNEFWYLIFACFFGIFCLTLIGISDDMRDTLEQALQAAEENYRLAYLDDLTGLPNRAQMKRLTEAAIIAQRPFALHFLDVDRFKRLNDSYGHPFGDRVLVNAANLIEEAGESSCVVSRFSGDEFLVIQYDVRDEADTERLVARLLEGLGRKIVIDGIAITIACSIGTAFYPRDGRSMSEALRRADMALYAAKAGGRNCQRYFRAEMENSELRRMRVESQLREAIANGELSLAFQPLIDTQTRRVKACEALIRWDHPLDGRVPPDQFLPIVEECGLMDAITEFTLSRACRAAALWPADIAVAVNISPSQLKRPDIVDRVREIAGTAGLRLSRLELEITENLFLDNDENLLCKLEELRRHGVKLSLDDFGTGYSNLSQLSRLPLDKIKIDKAFIQNATANKADHELLRGIITLIKAVGLAIVVEGVETYEQLDLLIMEGTVAEIQGYIFAKPMAEVLILDLLRVSEGKATFEAHERPRARGLAKVNER